MTERLAYSQSEFCRAIGINRSTLWRWAQKGRIQFVVIGGRKFVSVESLNANTDVSKDTGVAGVTPGGNKAAQLPRNEAQHDTRTTAEKFSQL